MTELLSISVRSFFAEPRTEILGDQERFVDSTSSLNLTCLVISPNPPAYIFWKLTDKVVFSNNIRTARRKWFWAFRKLSNVFMDLKYEIFYCLKLPVLAQCAERMLNEIAKPLNETFTGLMCMLQGFRICFV